jgi:tyrosine-protein phosphatase YwqE
MGILDLFRNKKRSLYESGLLEGFHDCHSHILPGVDDGVKTIEESLEVLAYMESVGIRELWCTPHVMDDVPNETELLRAKFSHLKESYHGNVKLHLAAEYMLDSEFEARLSADDLIVMKDDIVLVETSANVPPFNLLDMLERLKSKGYRPMMAHPERYRYMDMPDYRHLREMGVLMQLNLGSVVGYYGESAQDKAYRLLSHGWYNVLGSDCHRYSAVVGQFDRAVLPDEVVADLAKVAKTSVF